MTIEPTNPDAPYLLNGVEVTGRELAEARQELSHRGVRNPHWAELSAHDQDMAALSAANWLRSIAELVHSPAVPPDPDDVGPSPAQLGETVSVTAGEWTALDDYTQIWVYGDRSVDIAFQTTDVDDELRELRHLKQLQEKRMRAATERWRAEDPEGRALRSPDLGALLEWLMEQADHARSDI